MKIDKINKSSLLEKILALGAIGIGLVILLFIVTSTWIGYEVNRNCADAMSKYEGNCPQALEQIVINIDEPASRRNSAVWSLGQLGDPIVLPTLKTLYTGDIPDREPWNKVLSQYELKKAIKLLEGGKNITTVFWR